jgi:hypothetical protein
MESAMNNKVPLLSIALLATVIIGTAHAAYLESDLNDTAQPSEQTGTVQPVPQPPPRNAFIDLINQLDVGEAWRHGNLTVYPLILSRPHPSDIRTLDEAFDRGWLTVREKDSGQISILQVRNDSRQFVFMMSGEILAGGRQNRLMKDDVLLSPNSGFTDVAVYCGEKGRWSSSHQSFSSAGAVAQFDLRHRAAKSEAQAEVWSAIETQSDRAKVQSPTHDYQTIYRDDSVRRQLDEYADRFRGFSGSSVVGAVAVCQGRIIGCDIFSDPALFSRLWGKLIRAYAMDAVNPDRVRDSASTGDIRRFLDRSRSARFSPRGTPGAGELLDISGEADGIVLMLNGSVVHASLFGERIYHAPPPPPYWHPPHPRPPPERLPPEPMPPEIPVPLPQPFCEDNIWNFQVK